MLTQQLAIARSEDDGRIADTSFCGDTLSSADLSKIIFQNYCQFHTSPGKTIR